jgi:hypothetical protein
MFPGAGSPPTTVWTALRPHNWRPATSTEWLVELDMVTGEEGGCHSGVRRSDIRAVVTLCPALGACVKTSGARQHQQQYMTRWLLSVCRGVGT